MGDNAGAPCCSCASYDLGRGQDLVFLSPEETDNDGLEGESLCPCQADKRVHDSCRGCDKEDGGYVVRVAVVGGNDFSPIAIADREAHGAAAVGGVRGVRAASEVSEMSA